MMPTEEQFNAMTALIYPDYEWSSLNASARAVVMQLCLQAKQVAALEAISDTLAEDYTLRSNIHFNR